MSDEHIDPIDYAMDGLDDVARRRADQHLTHCAQCRSEVAEWREATAGLGASVDPVEPPPALRDAVLTGAARLPQEPREEVPAQRSSRSWVRRHPGRSLLAAAAAVVVIAGGVTVATRPWQHQTTVSAVERVEQAQDAQRATAPATADDGTLVMVTSTEQDKAVAILRGVPDAAPGKVYQAWIITASGPVSAGFLQPGKPAVLDGSIKGAKAAAVTVEPTGGSQQPTSKPLASVSMT